MTHSFTIVLADVERAGYRVAAVQPSERKTFDDINAELIHRPG